MAEIVETPGTGFHPVAGRLMSRRYVAAQNGRFTNRPYQDMAWNQVQ
jgi:hypothetical protein